MRHQKLHFLASACLLTLTSGALASNVTEFPDNGSEQLARGGAWLARASDPLATLYNPAGLAGQDTRLLLNANLSMQRTCFTRMKAVNDTTEDGVASGASYPEVCNKGGPFPNPQLAFTYRVSDRLGLGLAVAGPSAVGNTTWPEFAPDASGANQASPQRYLLTKADVLFLTPTIGAGYQVTDTLRVGASFHWGLATLQFSTVADATNQNGSKPADNDIKASLSGKDLFVPGVTLGTIWSPTSSLDVAGSFKWSAPIDASVDAATYVNYFRPAVAANGLDSAVKFGYTKDADCAFGVSAGVCGPGKGNVVVPVPMEAKLGLRYHQPVVGADPTRRDPMSQDKWDIEADFTFANNKTFDSLQVRFPADAQGNGVIPVNGTGGGTLPPIADVPHMYKNVFGVRVGGDYNVLPDQLAIRAGVFGETDGQEAAYQNIDFMGGARLGIAGGATYRLKLGNGERKRALDLSLGFMHMFVAEQSYMPTDPNAPGVKALGGVACNPGSNGNVPGDLCSDGKQKYRTNWNANLGTITSSLNVLNVGVTYRF